MTKLSKKMSLKIIALLLLVTTSVGIFIVLSGNVTVSYYDAFTTKQNINPTLSNEPLCTPDKLTTNSYTIVITEPFASLNSIYETKVIKKINVSSGRKKFFIKPGKYGMYIELENGKKILYNPLTLLNPKSDVRRDLQGPWFITLNPIANEINFYEGATCAL
jgi:hypothetical protein